MVGLTKHGVVKDSTFFSAGTVYLEEKARPSQDLGTSDISVRAEVEDGPLLRNRNLSPLQLFNSETLCSTLAVSDPSTSDRVQELPHASTSSSVRDLPCSGTSFASNMEQSLLEEFNVSTNSGMYSQWVFSETWV